MFLNFIDFLKYLCFFFSFPFPFPSFLLLLVLFLFLLPLPLLLQLLLPLPLVLLLATRRYSTCDAVSHAFASNNKYGPSFAPYKFGCMNLA